MSRLRLEPARCCAFAVAIATAVAAGPPAAAQPQAPPAPETDGLVVGTKEAPPFAVQGEDGIWRGIAVELWSGVADELELTYELRDTDLEGLFTGLEEGALDASVAALTVTAERVQRVDFTHPFYTSGLGIAVPRKQAESRWMSLLARFFSGDFARAVVALGLLLLAVGLVVWLLERRRNPEQFGGSASQGLGSGFWWSAVTMTTVGYGDKAPRTAAGRFVAIIWMFASIVIISGFTAAIASSLTVQQLAYRIAGPDDLPGNLVATVDGSTSEQYLRRNRVASRGYATPEEALRAVAAGAADAMVYDEPILRYFVAREHREQLAVLPVTFERQDYAIALAPGSPLRKPINAAILRTLQEPRWQDTLYEYLGR